MGDRQNERNVIRSSEAPPLLAAVMDVDLVLEASEVCS